MQLHTHRHGFPEDPTRARREVELNRAALAPLVAAPLRHLCYPSGVWSPRHFGWLAELGIDSATTCEVGFCDERTDPLALPRIFDGSHVGALQFEAEVCGLLELLRGARGRLRSLAARLAPRPLSPAPAALAPDPRSEPRSPPPAPARAARASARG